MKRDGNNIFFYIFIYQFLYFFICRINEIKMFLFEKERIMREVFSFFTGLSFEHEAILFNQVKNYLKIKL